MFMPRDTLTVGQIVAATVEMLDADGLEGLNMRALGQRLGSAATAVYWHVGSKDNLLALAADRAWNEIELPDPATDGWRAAAVTTATELYAMLARHPWLVQVFGAHPVVSRAKFRHDDHSLAIFEAGGFFGDAADQAATAVFTYVLGNAVGLAAAAAFERADRTDADRADYMRRAVQVAREFPHIRSRLDSPAAGFAATPEDSFRIGLDALLTGLTAALVKDRADRARR
jgi:AcrR family transcriptional regulator